MPQAIQQTVEMITLSNERRIPLGPKASDWVGIGYKSRYRDDVLGETLERPLGWLEIHAENYMVAGGPRKAELDALRERYPISCHGVGLSIGGADPLNKAHLERLVTIQQWVNPALFSEHLAWSSHGRNYYNDLLPLPYTEASLAQVVSHLGQLQDALGRQVLLENPSSYLQFDESTLSETEFLTRVVQESGCGLLLDVNNVHVSAHNLGFDARDYLAEFPLTSVGEIHVAGHKPNADESAAGLLIDSHDAPVADPVWALYSWVVDRIGLVPTLIERDGCLPEFTELAAEVAEASRLMATRAAA